jgi:outer membrane protein OmpA-like peptidoglycan-associated protein
VFYGPNGEQETSIIGDQFFAHLGASVVLANRVRLALNLPIPLAQTGNEARLDNQRFASDNDSGLGDVRFGADVRLFGEYREPISLAVGAQLFVPTGSQDSYTGDGAARIMPRLMVAGEVTPFVYAGHMGFTYRGNDEAFAGTPRGSDLAVAVAAGVRVLDGRLVIGPELYGSSVVGESEAFFARRTTPLELILGAHWLVARAWRLGAGAGPGLTRALGTPELRGLLSLEWHQPFEERAPSDRDGDTILDVDDACPAIPGVRSNDARTNGCPPVRDRDGDGIPDDADACPDAPGAPSDEPKRNGCPDRDEDKIIDPEDACPAIAGIPSADPKANGCPDVDGDGIIDSADACPTQPGIQTDDPKTNGCPPPKDSDGDGILDGRDACPNAAGPADPDSKKNGCPVARVEQGQIRIREQVQFAYNSAQILKASDFILEAVLKIFHDNVNTQAVSVQGHTDSKGGDAYNKQLSRRRAQAVVAWLVRHGIDKQRLQAEGFGEERPIDTNDTDEGRANNRRVEFHILDQPGATQRK